MADSKESSIWYSIDAITKSALCRHYGICSSFTVSLWGIHVCAIASSCPTKKDLEFFFLSHIRSEAKIAAFNWGCGCFPQLRSLGVGTRENKPTEGS